jgi:flagellar hook-associated protein 3
MMMFDGLIRNLARGTKHTQALQEVLSTGKKINRLSDDPIGSSRIIRYQEDLQGLSQYKENIKYGNSWLNMSDSVLQDMQALLSEAKNIAIAQSTSTVSSESRTGSALQVKNLYEQLINYANTKLGGSYLFGGSMTNGMPFNADGTYNGNGEDLTVEILQGMRTKINLAGSEFLVADLNPALSTAAATSGTTSTAGLTAKNTNAILADPGGVSEYRVTFTLSNGRILEAAFTTDSDPTRDELGAGIAEAVNRHYDLNQYIRADYDAASGTIAFEAKEAGAAGNAFRIDGANSTIFQGTPVTAFTGGSSVITSGFIFDATNSDIVFSEAGGADRTANIIADGGAVPERVYTGDQVADFIERALESQSNNVCTYSVSYDETTNRFTIVNDAGNGGTLDLKWGAAGTTAGQTLGFNSVDSGAYAPGGSDTSDHEVEFNVLNDVNDTFRLTIDGTPSTADIDISAGAYTAASLAAEMQTQINNDASFAGIAVDFGTTVAGQFTITSGTTGTSSTVTLTGDTSDDFLRTVGLDGDFEVAGTSPTPLADLNGGAGVTAGNITITDRSGATAVVAVLSGQTITDVIAGINAAGVAVTAAVNTNGNGIILRDTSGFPLQNLVVGDSATARDLGIVGDKPGTIYGKDLNPGLSSATRAAALKGGNGLTLTALKIANGLEDETIDLSRAASITDILTALNNLGISVQAAVNSSKTGLDVKSTSAQSAAVVSEVDGGTTSSDLGIQGGQNFIKTLAVLQEALEKDDRLALLTMLDQFDRILSTLAEKGSETGVRSNKLDAMNNRITASETEISALKSDREDADMAEYLTKFAIQRTALEAVMSTAARTIELSLLNFLR